MTDAKTRSVRAESRAIKASYVLGKHKWTVTGDVYACHEGQPYTTYIKLSGCNPVGEFTCDNASVSPWSRDVTRCPAAETSQMKGDASWWW